MGNDETKTFAPYYDSILSKKMRNELGEVKMSPYTLSLVRNHALLVGMT
jgi:hypothetical protein